MSQNKLAAAKELIQEKHYDEARGVLRTMNDPTASRWLQQLESLSPSPPPVPSVNSAAPISKEAEQYYSRQNRKANRKRIGNGIQLVVMGIAALVVGALLAQPTPSIEQGGKMVVNLGLGVFFFPLGAIAILAGLYLLLKRRTN